jgi:hypothetical protein
MAIVDAVDGKESVLVIAVSVVVSFVLSMCIKYDDNLFDS